MAIEAEMDLHVFSRKAVMSLSGILEDLGDGEREMSRVVGVLLGLSAMWA